MTSMFTFYFLRYCNHNSQATLSQKLNKSAPTLIYPSSHAFKPLYVKPFTAFSTFHSRKKKSVVLFLEKRESLEGCYLEQYVLDIHYNPRQGLLTMRIDTPTHHAHAQTPLRKGLVRDKQTY